MLFTSDAGRRVHARVIQDTNISRRNPKTLFALLCWLQFCPVDYFEFEASLSISYKHFCPSFSSSWLITAGSLTRIYLLGTQYFGDKQHPSVHFSNCQSLSIIYLFTTIVGKFTQRQDLYISKKPTTSLLLFLFQRHLLALFYDPTLFPLYRYVLDFSEVEISPLTKHFRVQFFAFDLQAHSCSLRNGHPRILQPLFQPPQVRVDVDPMGLFNVPFWPALVHI